MSKKVECYICDILPRPCMQDPGSTERINYDIYGDRMRDRGTSIVQCIERNGLNLEDFKTETPTKIIYKKKPKVRR